MIHGPQSVPRPINSVKPPGNLFPGPDRWRLAHEDQEGRLEGIFSIVGIAEDAATDTQNRQGTSSPRRYTGLVRIMAILVPSPLR